MLKLPRKDLNTILGISGMGKTTAFKHETLEVNTLMIGGKYNRLRLQQKKE
jgi:ABC-type Fe3+/spermidine/putrescine transport system ATPase subunit